MNVLTLSMNNECNNQNPFIFLVQLSIMKLAMKKINIHELKRHILHLHPSQIILYPGEQLACFTIEMD